MGENILTSDFSDWIQPDGRWTILHYAHSGVAHVNAIGIAFEPGESVLFPPGVRGAHARVGAGTGHWYATFDLPGDIEEPEALPIHFTLEPEWQVRFIDVGARNVRGVWRGKAFLWDMLCHISQPRAFASGDERLRQAEAWIRANISRPFPLSALESELGVPSRTLHRLFRAGHGTTTKGYVLEIRTRQATKLLLETDLSVKAVAAKVGVPDLQQFNKLIRTFTGLSPRELRKTRTVEGHRSALPFP